MLTIALLLSIFTQELVVPHILSRGLPAREIRGSSIQERQSQPLGPSQCLRFPFWADGIGHYSLHGGAAALHPPVPSAHFLVEAKVGACSLLVLWPMQNHSLAGINLSLH